MYTKIDIKIDIKNDLLKLVLMSLLTFLALPAKASTVYWGGVSFASWDDRQALFPNVAKFLCRGGGGCVDSNLDSWALGRVLNAEFSAFDLSTDLISPDQIEAVIMTPMITGESLAVVKDITNGKVSYIHVYRIYASLVFFEVGSGRLISAKPVVVQYTDTLPLIADSEAVRQGFQRLANPVAGGVNLFDELFKRAVNTSPFSFSEKYARVASINISPQALSELDSALDVSAWKTQISRQLEAYIVDATDGPLVPGIPGDHLTGEFAATFSSGSKVIKLPAEVAYEFSVDISKFKEIVKVDRKQKTNCHAVKLTLRLNGPFDTILEAPLTRTKRSCGVIAADKQLDRTYYFTQSLFSLLKEASASLSAKPNKEFLKRAAPKSKDLDKQFIKAWESALDSSW
jgi:hypothetical protein